MPASLVRKLVPRVQRYSEADVPTEYGTFHVIVYREDGSPYEHCALVKGDVSGQEGVPVRVHSECFTGEVLHSLKCDCREQLDAAMRYIANAGTGAILYLRQEGRGIGLGNKIKAYALQESGADTVDANRMLGFGDDLRRYYAASAMLADLNIRSIALLTNNPAKVKALRADGIDVASRIPVHITPNSYSRGYLDTKRERMGHMLPLDWAPEDEGDGAGEGDGDGDVGREDTAVKPRR